MILSPPETRPAQLSAHLRERGFAVLLPDALAELLGQAPGELEALAPSWERLPPDGYLRDGGRYRSRRHSCFVIDVATATVTETERRAHWQSLEYNALHGGIERWFEPMEPAVVALPVWAHLLRTLSSRFAALAPARTWHVEAHQFRIDTASGIGRPTPEGAHRDGVDFVAVILVARGLVKGGETRVFEAAGPSGVRFTITEPWTMLLLDDARVIHETTPIQPVASGGVRDTLVITFRAAGFQGR